MRLTRSQLIIVGVLTMLTVAVWCFLTSVVVRNLGSMSQPAAPAADGPLGSQAAGEPSTTPAPTATATPPATPTPTLAAPQTRYDLQVARDPESADLRVQRGYAYMALGAYSFAAADFDVAVRLEPTSADAYLGRGEAYFHTKEWSAALMDFEGAIALNPDLADAFAWAGRLYSLRGQHPRALEDLSQAAALEPAGTRNHLWLAEALLRSGDPGGAVAEYGAVLSLDRASVEAYVGRAMALAEQGDLAGAQIDLVTALDITPYDPVALNGQAWFYAWYLHDNLGEAEQLAQRAIAAAEGDFVRARYFDTLGWTYYLQGRYEEAVATLEAAAELATVEGECVYGEIQERLEQARGAQ